MEMTFRWYGEDDETSLDYIRQIPGVKGIVTAIYDIPVGEVWPENKIKELKSQIEEKNLKLSVIESVPVHEDIKMGKPSRDKLIENYCETIKNLGKNGIDTVCYNFMPLFDWTRTDLAHELPDGSHSLGFDDKIVQKMDPVQGDLKLPGWDESYTTDELKSLIADYKDIDKERLWQNLEYFIKKVLPVAEEYGVKMAIHPDDPPYDIFGLPRIIINKEAIGRFLDIYDSEYNGLTLCVGTYASDPINNCLDILEYGLKRKRVNFVHTRNILLTGDDKSFVETAHMSQCGSIDMYKVMKMLYTYNWSGPIRPDHGRMIWGEQGRPGYGLYDRALGATYLQGLWEAIVKENKQGE